jgi:hypothetical protein
MRCDHVPARLTSVNPVARWRARRHLADCPLCGPDRAIIEGLGDIPPLPARYRTLWLAVGRKSRPWTIRRDLALAAAVLGVSIIVLLVIRPLLPHPLRPPIVTNNPEPPADPTSLRELDGLRAALDPLDGELADLRRRAELLDARRDTDRLLATSAWPDRRGM